MSAQSFIDPRSIIDQLQDVRTAFNKLNEVYDNVNQQFSQARDLRRFQARKQEYKKIRDEAWRWFKSVGRTPTERIDYERGTEADNPDRWMYQAYLVRQELRATLQAVEYNLPVETANPYNLPISSVAPNLYLISPY